jgi:chromosome segregation ATPase
VAFITWGEALREGRQERAMAERSTERAELEARMEQNAAAASEAAEQIYTAVEAERVTNSKQVAQLQHQLQELRAAAAAAAADELPQEGDGYGETSEVVKAAVAAAVEEVKRASEQNTQAAVAAAREEVRMEVEEEMSVLTPRESARARLAAREAELESAAAAAVEELRHVCQTEALTEREALRRQLEAQLEQARASAATDAAALAAAATEESRLRECVSEHSQEVGAAKAELETMRAKEAELDSLLRGSREEFLALEEKLRVAVTDSGAVVAAERESREALEVAQHQSEEMWRAKLEEAVEAAALQATADAAAAQRLELEAMEADAEASSELAVAEALLEAEAEKEEAVAAAVEGAVREAETKATATLASLREEMDELRTEAEEEKSVLTPRESAASRFAAREEELLEQLAQATLQQQVAKEAAEAALSAARGEADVIRRELREAEEVASALTPREPAAAKLEQADVDARERERVLLEQLEDLQDEMAFVQSAGSELEETVEEKEAQMVELRGQLKEAQAEVEAVQVQAKESEANAVAAARAWGQERIEATERRAERTAEQLNTSTARMTEAEERLQSLQFKCAGLRLSSRLLLPILHSWAAWAEGSARQKRRLLQLLSRRVEQSVCLTFDRWLEVCVEMRRQRVLISRCMNHMLDGCLRGAWLGWCELLTEVKERRRSEAHHEAMNALHAELHEEKMRVLAPCTHLHCKTCRC